MRSSTTKHQPILSNSLIFTISKFQIMKKTYNQPTCLVVVLGTCKMMAESLGINKGGASISSSEDILVKEQNMDVNLWDNEW